MAPANVKSNCKDFVASLGQSKSIDYRHCWGSCIHLTLPLPKLPRAQSCAEEHWVQSRKKPPRSPEMGTRHYHWHKRVLGRPNHDINVNADGLGCTHEVCSGAIRVPSRRVLLSRT